MSSIFRTGYLTEVAHRIAAILLMEPAMDGNYVAVKEAAAVRPVAAR